MALAKPSLSSTAAFDAALEHTFTFTVTGGDKVKGNKLTIKRNDTGVIVYNSTVTTEEYKHVLPANTLTNGVYYVASIQTKDASNNYSASSNLIQFWCFSTPAMVFTNKPEDDVINNNEYFFDVTYTQQQEVLLDYYRFVLYDKDGNLIDDKENTETVYIFDRTPPPTYIHYLIYNLDNDTTYKIKIVGATVYGQEVESELYTFDVKYNKSQFTSAIKLTNNCSDGRIYIDAEIHDLVGKSKFEPVTYITENDRTLADLTDGNYALWEEEISIKDDYTMYITGRKFTNNAVICTIGDNKKIYYREFVDENDDRKAYIEFVSDFGDNSIYSYRAISNYIDAPLDTDYLVLYMLYGDNTVDLSIENIGGGS